jgi:hypothetical protein
LYVIGDEVAWKSSTCISTAKEIIDTFAIREIKSILNKDLSEQEKDEALLKASNSLPSLTAFSLEKYENVETGEIEYSADTTSLIKGLSEDFIKNELSKEQLKRFGFNSINEVDNLKTEVKENVVLGMKLFYLLEPVYKVNNQMDASCCSILFCKAIELQMKDCFTKSLKDVFPNFMVKGIGQNRSKIALRDARNNELTLGSFCTILRNNAPQLGQRMKLKGQKVYDEDWWTAFEDKLRDCTNRRNQCCHSGLFSWKEQSILLFDIFMQDGEAQKKSRDISIGGIMFNSQIGKEL